MLISVVAQLLEGAGLYFAVFVDDGLFVQAYRTAAVTELSPCKYGFGIVYLGVKGILVVSSRFGPEPEMV